MIKSQELSDQTSCFNRARMNEMMFITLERDVAYPATIRFWCSERIRLGKNYPADTQIVEALMSADYVEAKLRER